MRHLDRKTRFAASKCDRCGKATPARQNDTGDLFTLPDEFGEPLRDQGDFCARCCANYDRANWIAWFREHRPEIVDGYDDADNLIPSQPSSEQSS